MKKLLAPFLLLLLIPQTMAFDPIGPPPEKTMEWTMGFIATVVIPRMDFDETTTLGDCVDFLNSIGGAPKEYQTEIDGSALGEAKLLAPCPVKFQARNIHLIEVLAKLADAIPANLLIGPGKIRLIPKVAVEPTNAPSK